MNLSPVELIDKQVSALFSEDEQGRLLHIREPGYEESELYPAPRFFMGRTLQGNIWRFRHDVPDDIVHTIEELCLAEPTALTTSSLKDPALHDVAIQTILSKHTQITEVNRGPAYWIPSDIQPTPSTVLISEANKSLLEANFPWKITSKSNFRTAPLAAMVVNEAAVAICYCARITSNVAEAGVETAEEYRGNGYAGHAVAKWADVMYQNGMIPLYSTSWENVASQSVARKLNLVLYGEDWSIT